MESDRKKKKLYPAIPSKVIFKDGKKVFSEIVVREGEIIKTSNLSNERHCKKKNLPEPMRYSRREKKVKRDSEYIYLEEIDLINKVDCEGKNPEESNTEFKQPFTPLKEDGDKLVKKESRRGRKRKEDSVKKKIDIINFEPENNDVNKLRSVFTRMDKEGSTSLPFVVPSTAIPVVQTLGQKVDPTGGPIPFPKPLKVKMPPKNPVPPPPPPPPAPPICELLFEGEDDSTPSAFEPFSPVRVEGDPIFDVISTSTYLLNEANKPTSVLPVSFRDLRSLSSLGINMEFLDVFESQYALQCKLNETGNLITKLSDIQKGRLSKGRKDATQQEIRLAGKVGRELMGLMKMAPPGSLVSSDIIQKSLGIVIDGPN